MITLRRLCVLCSVCLLASLGLAQGRTYLALGDSIGWGFQPNDYSPSYGDKGYVKRVADYLKQFNRGARPKLLNGSVPAETSSSFFDTSSEGRLLNFNYWGNSLSQSQWSASKIASELSAGRSFMAVTYALGANDLLNLMSSDFLSKPYEEQQAAVDAAISAAAAKIDAAVSALRQKLADAPIYIPGYYNPYSYDPNSSINRIAQYGMDRLNTVLAVTAFRYQATFVDIASAFVGNELSLTWIGEGDVHPRDAGYVVIANRLNSAIKIRTRLRR